MTESVAYEQNMVGGGEVMEVMMTGGDGGEMNEDTLAQVVNMLQMEGQLTGGNHTIIIRQPGSSEIQMIHTTNNGGELIVSKASEADIQALQSGNGILENVSQEILEGQQGQMVMMDEGGNLVEGVVQIPEESQNNVMQLAQSEQLQAMTNSQNNNLIEVPKNGDVIESSEILECLVQMDKVGNQNLIDTALNQNLDPTPTINTKPITISTTTSKPKPVAASSLNGEVVSIKINTGLSRKKENKGPRVSPKNVIKISTVTGQQKYQPPKFHKCEACAINFVSKVAYMNHMENCPSKRKSFSPANNKSNITYTCVFCETKFKSRLILMQHVRTCDKAKSSKNLSANSKLKVTTSESKLKLASGLPSPKNSKNNLSETIKRQNKLSSSKLKEDKLKLSKKRSILDPEDEPFLEDKDDIDSEFEDEKDIVYDDEDDINEEEMMEDDNIEETIANKRSQKHLGPIIVKGMFKCRDCSRTFSKEYQYNRHVKACTNAPLNTARIDSDPKEAQVNAIPVSAGEAVPPVVGVKRKRGRPPAISKENINEEFGNPNKKQAVGPKVVSVNPKKIGPVRGRPRYTNYSGNESDDEIMNYLSSTSRIKEEAYGKSNKVNQKIPVKSVNSSTSSMNKIVKISPSDTLIKQTGRAILSKMNKEKFSKLFKEMPFCGLCGDKFKSIQELSLHTQICHSEDLLNLRDSLDGKGNLSSIKCPLCDLYFVSPHILLLHMVSFHDKDLKSVQEELEVQNLNLVCPFCSDISVTQDLLKEHLATKHLDKLINKPSNTVSPMTIDVHAFIKDKNNGSILPTSKLLKKEKVLCPECGLFFLKSYFGHHRCAAETYSISARKFICSESQCSGLSFYKLIHLLTHLQQVHEKSLNCKSENFDSLTQFLDWLKKEETRSKMKYTKALQRMKQGKLSTVWICHRFHNAMRDPSSISGENETGIQSMDRLNQCYSRIHAETSYNISTSRYDGRTLIKYYPDHKHTSDTDGKPEPQILPNLSTSSVNENPSSLQTFNSEESAFSDAAELKQLLEDDEEFIGQKPKPMDNSFDAQQLARFEDLQKVVQEVPATKTLETDSFTEELSKDSQSQGSLVTPNTSLHTMNEANIPTTLESVEKMINEESLPSSELSEGKLEAKDDKEVNSLVSLSAADLLLEKMLGEHDGGETSSVVTMETDETRSSPPETVQIENLGPTEAKITDVDMLEAFGDCITPEESSNSTISNTQQNSLSSEPPTETEPESSQEQKELTEPEQQEDPPIVQDPSSLLDDEQEQSFHESEKEKEEELQQEETMETELSDAPVQMEPVQNAQTEETLEDDAEPIQENISSNPPELESEQSNPPELESEQSNPPELESEQSNPPELESEQSNPPELESEQSNPPELESEQSNPPELESEQSNPAELESEQSSSEVHEKTEESKEMVEEEEEEDEDEEEEEEDDDDDDGEERTYVLPADLEEWSKLFEMVSAEVASREISDEEIEEAKTLLTFESQIMSLNEEKQIEIFNRLCSLANVQMT